MSAATLMRKLTSQRHVITNFSMRISLSQTIGKLISNKPHCLKCLRIFQTPFEKPAPAVEWNAGLDH